MPQFVLAIALVVLLGGTLIWPMAQVVRTGFVTRDGSPTLSYIALIFSDPLLVRGLLNAAGVAIVVTAVTLALSLPLAALSVRYDFRGRAILAGLLLVPLVLPPFVGAIGMRLVLGRFGPLTWIVQQVGAWFGQEISPLGIDWMGRMRLVGIIVVEVLHLYPIMLLNLQASLANIDPAMEQAAANLGAGRWRRFWKITLPLMRPGLFAGCTLVLIWSFTELGTPLMFDFYTITPVQIFKQITDVSDNPMPYALVVVMLAASALLYIIGKLLLGRSYDSGTSKASVAWTPKRLSGRRGLLAALPFVIVFAAAVLPHLSVVLTSFSEVGAWHKSLLPAQWTLGHYAQALVDELALPSIRNSIFYATIATSGAVVVGLLVAVLVVRTDVPGRGAIDALAMLPLAVPGLVLAFGYLSISIWLKQKMGRNVPAVLDVQNFPPLFLIIAYGARRLPYIVRAAVAGLQQTPRDLELAAANLGASRWRVMRRITVPLILANLLAGALLAFAFSMLEVSDSLILAQRSEFYPITKAIWELSQRLGDGLYVAGALGVWAMALLTLTILAANALLGKKLGAVFRV
ncbi:MAG: iron ABC transporter permease [Phycisphaerales bacterium]|jgi:iron(III) transport system permease protein|nr:iron ABC transporter permease [Phycisphaerales bacterium]